MKIQFAITHNLSTSKGWGRYKASTVAGSLVQSATGNEWVSASHSGECEAGSEITVVLETMERVGKGSRQREVRDAETYRLIAEAGQTAELGYWNGLQVAVDGARRLA